MPAALTVGGVAVWCGCGPRGARLQEMDDVFQQVVGALLFQQDVVQQFGGVVIGRRSHGISSLMAGWSVGWLAGGTLFCGEGGSTGLVGQGGNGVGFGVIGGSGALGEFFDAGGDVGLAEIIRQSVA